MDVIIYHNADPDGNFSGAIALKANPTAETIGYNYEPEFQHIIEKSAGKKVVMVDVSPKGWNDMHRLCEVAEKVVWIDHHASALRQMEAAETPSKFSNFELVYEAEKWGAAKRCFEYFFPAKPLPKVVEMVAGYDAFRDYGTEKWRLEYFPFRFAVGNLKSPQAVLEAFELSISDDTASWLERGRAIAEYLDDDNQHVVNSPALCHETVFKFQGKMFKVLAVNKGLFGDMFKSRNLADFDFVVGFYSQSAEWKISLRGAGKEIDLGAIAKTFGGGGHKDAAGFSLKTFADLREVLFIS